MNRIDRVTAILIQLQSKKIVKAQEIADRFGMSLRTVYRIFQGYLLVHDCLLQLAARLPEF